MKYQKTLRQTFQNYMAGKIKLKTYQKVGIMFLVVVISGFIGWLYEFLLAWAENGRIYMQGGNLLPWMNIYAIGAVLLVPIVLKIRRYPWAVFLVSALVTGIVELIGGWLVYTIGNGTRYWNYAEGPWAFGSINGFVCPLSVTIFGISALALTYLVLPFCTHLALKMTKRAFLILAISLFVLIISDELISLTLKNLNQPNAMDFYRSLGLEYKNYS
ncbi:MAG: putative ABC transporter permease [Candidatus Saccharibacteria bacterium]|nr:putative ABC transporter permease [Candidatus Saccharibacteria bacterium]